MAKQLITCENGHQHDEMKINGYSFGERLLEDVMFIVWIDDGKWFAKVSPEGASYFKRMNQEMWLQECVEYSEQNDSFECIECGTDVFV